MDNFLQLAEERYSVRKFLDKPLRTEDLSRILEAAKLAPTAKNQQPQRILVVQSEEGLAKIDKVTKCRYGAPTVLVICYDKDNVFVNPWDESINSGDTDAAIVTTHMMLEAWDIGVASCWVQWFKVAETSEEFGLPDDLVPVSLLPLGYPSPDAEPAPRHSQYKDEDEMVQFV